MNVVIVGAGVMGLASALELLRAGHRVTVLEAAPRPGGLAGAFDFDGLRAEKFYHFICGQDRTYFAWLRRLGLSDRLRWRRTRMAIYSGGGLHPFGDPVSLLRFPLLSLPDRVRYGRHVWSAKRLEDWKPLESVRGKDWLLENEGETPYRVIWEPLLRHKFGDRADSVSAAWIWSRIHRLASSRDRFFQEWLGYLEGGSGVFVDALVEAVREQGGVIRLECPAERILLDDGRVVAVEAGGEEIPAEALISTMPLPLLARIGGELPRSYLEDLRRIDNIGVRCIVLRLAKPLTSYFWVNANGDDVPICGLIEYTNLHPPEGFAGSTLVYSPHYASFSDPEYRRPDEEVFTETLDSISRMLPAFDTGSVAGYRVFRAPYAQPICPVGFTRLLAPIATPVPNLVAADTSHLLPHDRSISDSLALAERMTRMLLERIERPWVRATAEALGALEPQS